MQLLQQRDKKLIDVARSVGYESDAAFSKAFKRVVGVSCAIDDEKANRYLSWFTRR